MGFTSPTAQFTRVYTAQPPACWDLASATTNLFSLEDAVYKLSAHPATRFGLTQRGQIAEGFYADLVVFDAATVADRATYQDPHQYSVGVEHVLVNGVPIVRNGCAVEDLGPTWPGRYLKFRA